MEESRRMTKAEFMAEVDRLRSARNHPELLALAKAHFQDVEGELTGREIEVLGGVFDMARMMSYVDVTADPEDPDELEPPPAD